MSLHRLGTRHINSTAFCGKEHITQDGEQDSIGNFQIQGWEEELISPRPFVFREGAVPRCSLSEDCVGF